MRLILEKGMTHKYIRREGVKGHYIYYYKDGSTSAGKKAEPQETQKRMAGKASNKMQGTDATLKRLTTRQVTFSKPFVGKTGATLLGYEWPHESFESEDRFGNDITIRISDWSAADVSKVTGRKFVHKFIIGKADGTTETMSAESAAVILGVSAEFTRSKAKKMLEDEINKQAREAKAKARAEEEINNKWYATPLEALENDTGFGKNWLKHANWGKNENAYYYGKEKMLILKSPKGYRFGTINSGDEPAYHAVGIEEADITAQDIWDKNGNPVIKKSMRLIVRPDVQTIEELEKGRKPDPIGTIKDVPGTPYKRMKTATGWVHVKVAKNGTITDTKGKVVGQTGNKPGDGSDTKPQADKINNKTDSTATQAADPQAATATAAPAKPGRGRPKGSKTKTDKLSLSKIKNGDRLILTALVNGKRKTIRVTAESVSKDASSGEDYLTFKDKKGHRYHLKESSILGLRNNELNSNLSGAVQAGGTKVTQAATVSTDSNAKGPTSDPKASEGESTTGLKKIDPDRLEIIRRAAIRRDRMGYGQEVVYHGDYHKALKGKKGTLVAIGEHGYAMINVNGQNYSAAWRDIKATGAIKPHSVYDGLTADNVYACSGKFSETLRETLHQKIGTSSLTYYDLCKEFQKRGFTLHVVGGTVRDVLGGKASKDVDFIFDGSDNELEATLKDINPNWIMGIKRDSHLGLRSFTDGADVVDITPIHKYSPELRDMAKGWNLKEDALSRDIAMNTLQVNPLTNILIDATGHGIKDAQTNTINFADANILRETPVYLLRAVKFLGRGYKITDESHDLFKRNLSRVFMLTPKRIYSFLKNQIGEKDGEKGLLKFKDILSSYDNNLWDRKFETIYRNVISNYRGK